MKFEHLTNFCLQALDSLHLYFSTSRGLSQKSILQITSRISDLSLSISIHRLWWSVKPLNAFAKAIWLNTDNILKACLPLRSHSSKSDQTQESTVLSIFANKREKQDKVHSHSECHTNNVTFVTYSGQLSFTHDNSTTAEMLQHLNLETQGKI